MYATTEDVKKRSRMDLSGKDEELCEALLQDAAVIIDAYNYKASNAAKKIVSCNMIIRAMGSNDLQVPVGASQGTVSALGYSQTWTLGSGSTGELYLTKLDKKLLGSGNHIGFTNPFQEPCEEDE